MAKTAVDEAAMMSAAEVGVLFVHGIGRQPRGAALEEGANAIQAAVRSETGFDGIPAEERLIAQFGPVDLAGPGPASANLFVRVGADASPQRWLLTESHWADAFRSPGLKTTLVWILTVSPVLLLSRAGEAAVTATRAWRRMPLYFWRILFAWLWVVFVIPVGILLVAGLTITVLLRFFIPIQFIKDLLGRLEVIVTAYLGDSYLFTGNEVSRAAMATRVGDDIDWIAAHADRVVVVSHSQGAAVTALALASREPVDTLITFGAGIGQLDWLRRAVDDPSTKRRRNRMYGMAVWMLLSYASVAAYVWLILQSGAQTDWWWAALQWVWAGWIAFTLIMSTWILIGELKESGRAPVGHFGESVSPDRDGRDLAVRWWDLWASADPVPGGPSTTYSYSDVDPFRVFNRGNFLTDHSTYYRNREEFVGRVLLAALQPPEGAQPSSLRGSVERQTADYLDAALPLRSCLRQRRGRWLEAWRTGLAALAIAVMWRWWPPLAEGVGGSIEWLAGVFPSFAEAIRSASGSAVRIGLAVLVVALGAMIIYWVSLVMWWRWAKVEQRIVNSGLQLERLQDFGAQIRLTGAQLPFVVMAVTAPTLAAAAAVFVLVADVGSVQTWIGSSGYFVAFSLSYIVLLVWLVPKFLSGRWRDRAKAIMAKSALGLMRALPEKVVRDPRQYKPFRHLNNQTRPS